MELLLRHQERSVPGQGLAPDDMDVDNVEGKVLVNFPSSAALANDEDEGLATFSPTISRPHSNIVANWLPPSLDRSNPDQCQSKHLGTGWYFSPHSAWHFLQPLMLHASQEAINVDQEPGPSMSAQRLSWARPVRGGQGWSPISLATSESLLPHGQVETQSCSQLAILPGDDPSVSSTESETLRMKWKALPDEDEHEGSAGNDRHPV
jgi:hypothetical protein